jgi:hypothetical protein
MSKDKSANYEKIIYLTLKKVILPFCLINFNPLYLTLRPIWPGSFGLRLLATVLEESEIEASLGSMFISWTEKDCFYEQYYYGCWCRSRVKRALYLSFVPFFRLVNMHVYSSYLPLLLPPPALQLLCISSKKVLNLTSFFYLLALVWVGLTAQFRKPIGGAVSPLLYCGAGLLGLGLKRPS